MQSPLRLHPLALPEILLHLRRFLGTRALTVCLRVCREWHQIFLPQIWRSVTISKETANRIGPEELQKHADFVESLHVIGELYCFIQQPSTGQPSIALLNGLYCRNLTRLELDHDNVTVEIATALIQQHRSTLKDINYASFVQDITLTDEILDALDSCVHLETLNLPHAVSSALFWDQSRFLRNIWMRLRCLTVFSFKFSENEERPKDATQILRTWTDSDGSTVQSKLENISLFAPHRSSYPIVVLSVLLSPKLRGFYWMVEADSDLRRWPTHFLADAIRSGHWVPNHLESLGMTQHEFATPDFRSFLDAIPRLRNLDVHKTNFDVNHWQVLRLESPLFLTQLRSLNIQDCQNVSGEVVQQILCEMPNLEHFGAPYIQASNLLEDDRPWICSRLRTLEVFFFLDDETGVREGTDTVLTQLAKLENLEQLELRLSPFNGLRGLQGRRFVKKPENALDLRLDLGLFHLSSLTQLARLNGTFDLRATPWTKAEAEWVLANWSSLVSITGVALSQEAVDLLSHGGRIALDCIVS